MSGRGTETENQNNTCTNNTKTKSSGMGVLKCCEPPGGSGQEKGPGFFENGQLESRSGCCKCEIPPGADTASLDSMSKKVLSYSDAPFYLRFNPYITGGYRTSLSPRECIKR
jgi:hypothetical protein